MNVQGQHLLDELQTIEEDCLYTAQAHFEIASQKSSVVRAVLVGFAALSALGGGLVALGLCPKLALLSVVGGLVAAVVGALGADREGHTHVLAANVLTRLRREARTLRCTLAHELTPDDFGRDVRRLAEHYNTVIQGLPPTNEAAFEKARKRINAGRFTPDFKELPLLDEPTKLPMEKSRGPDSAG